jgi:hypothetical protein
MVVRGAFAAFPSWDGSSVHKQSALFRLPILGRVEKCLKVLLTKGISAALAGCQQIGEIVPKDALLDLLKEIQNLRPTLRPHVTGRDFERAFHWLALSGVHNGKDIGVEFVHVHAGSAQFFCDFLLGQPVSIGEEFVQIPAGV